MLPGTVRISILIEAIGMVVLGAAVIGYIIMAFMGKGDGLKDIALTAVGALIILTKDVADKFTKTS
jgi:hypothetical protein